MLTRAAALAAAAIALFSSGAVAGPSGKRFMVGTAVVRAATVTLSPDGIQQVATRGTPAPMLLIANQVKPMPRSGSFEQISHSHQGYRIATVVY